MNQDPPPPTTDRMDRRPPLPGVVAVLVSMGAILLFILLPWNGVFRGQVVDATRSIPAEWRFNRGLRTSGEKAEAFHAFNYRASVFVRGRAGTTDVVLLPPKSYIQRFYDPDEIEWVDARYAVYMAGWFHPTTMAVLDGSLGPREIGSEASATARALDAVRRAVVVDMVDGRPALAVVQVNGASELALVRARYRSQGWDR